MSAEHEQPPHREVGDAIAYEGLTREAFIARAALAAGAVYGAGAVAPVVREALAQEREKLEVGGDINVLNFALTLALIEHDLFTQGVDRAPLGGRAASLAREMASNERTHIRELRSIVGRRGGRPVAPPETDFGTAFSSQARFLEVAALAISTTVAALDGASIEMESKEVLVRIATMNQVEARQVALVRLLRGEDPAPKAFEDTLSISQARDRLADYVPVFG
jgi:ferritin-like protein